jgi:hypothetical protein
VRQRPGEGWHESALLIVDGMTDDDNFGREVAISDDVILIGAPAGGTAGGAVVVYCR